MAVDTTIKTGYWRINPATGEREWIEQSNQPKQPKLKDEQIGAAGPPKLYPGDERFGAAGPPKLYTGVGEEPIVAPVTEEEITPVRPISPLITSKELYELDTAWGGWWDQYAQTGKFPTRPTEETLKPYYEQWVQAATKWETDNPPLWAQTPPAIDRVKLTESANLYNINDKDFVSQAQLVDLSRPFEERTLSVPFEQYLTWEQAQWLGYDVPEGSVVKVVPVVGGAPQLYVLPDPEAISKVMAELSRPREELIENLRGIYPRMFDPANSWGYSNDEIPDMVINSIQRWMADDYSGFVEDLFERVGEVEGEKLLRQFGVTEENILITLDYKEQEARVSTLISDVFPDFKTVEQLNTLIDTDWNLFVETIQWKGATSEKRKLLESLGYNPDEINSFFNVIRVMAPVDGVRQEITIDTQLGKAYDRNGVWVGSYNVVTHEFTDLPEENFAKDTWDAIVYGGQHLYHQSKQFLVSALPNFLFRDTYQWERDLYGDAYADKVDAGNKRLRDEFRTVYNLNQSEFERWEAANPQLAPPEFAQENIVDRLKDNPLKTIIYEFASTAPFMLAVMGTTIAVTAATGNPLLGVTAGAAVATPPQSQDAYDALLAAGATERQAGLLALPIGLTMSAIESIGDMPYLKKVFPTIFKMVEKGMLDQVGKMTLTSLLKKGLTTFTMVEITETIEEVLQDAVLNAGIRTFNENQAIFEGLEDTILRTLAATAPLALFGAGASLRRVTGAQIQGQTDAQLKAKGYIQDPKTGNWYQQLKDALKDEGGFVIPGEFFGRGEEALPTDREGLETFITEHGRNVELIKAEAKKNKWTDAEYIAQLGKVAADLAIPTQPSGRGFEVETPVAQIVELVAGQIPDVNMVSSGFHANFSKEWNGIDPSWSIVIQQVELPQNIIEAADKAGLQINKRPLKGKVPEGQIYDIYLPGVGQTEIEKATAAFNEFATILGAGREVTAPAVEPGRIEDIEDIPIQSVATAPVFDSMGYRVDYENMGIPRDATAADVLRFEAEELGNDIAAMGVTPQLLKELENYPAHAVTWVTRDIESARDYLTEGMGEEDISRVEYVRGGRIVAFDHQGGYLVLASADVAAQAPMTEPGQPEAGLQPSMLPEEVSAKEVRPKGKGEIVQISMEDQLKLEQARREVETAPDEDKEAYEAQAEIEGIRVSLETDPIAQKQIWVGVSKRGKPLYRGLDFFISLREQSFPDYFTVKQAKLLNPHADFSKYTQKGLAIFNKVPRDEALDWMASELGAESAEEIAERVMEIRADKRRLRGLEAVISTHYTETPLPAVPEVTPRQSVTNERTAGQPTLTPAQVRVTLALFGKYIENPDAIRAWELTRDLRSEVRTTRGELLKARAQELIVDKGVPVEEAMKQAINETMSGELPAMRTDYLSDLTEKMRNVLFNKLYQTLEGEPYEMMSTHTALTNALRGRAIPRDPGTTGRSAFTRLQRVFGDQPKVLKAIEKMTEEHKPLEDIVEGIYRESGQPPIPIDGDMAEYLRKLKDIPNGYRTLLEPEYQTPTIIDTRSSIDLAFAKTELELSTMLAKGEIDEDAYKLARAEARSIAYPTAPPTRYDPPIQDAIDQIPLWPKPVRDDVIKVLKEIGMSPIDIGNFLRANKASFDFSFWRQQAPLIASHPVAFAQANVDAWKAIWSQKSAEASWEKITRDYLYQIYEVCAEKGGDFLRPLELKKGTAQWRGTEEFGYLTQDRVIPKLTSKLPWVKISARAFETGTNSHNWLIFKGYYKGMLELSQQYASGKKTLPVGQVFDIEKEMVDFSKMLANFTARGSLGRAAQLAPALSSGFFAPRATIGRILSIKDLANPNPRVRRQAWINASTFVSTVGGIILLGAAMGLWSVEKDPRSAEYMSIRIGNTRIDPWGGYRQFFVFFTRCITGTGVSSVTGAEYEINPLMAVTNFVRGKGSPLASIIADFWTGKTFVGEEVDITSSKQWIERFAPFAVWDIYEAYMEDPTTAMIAAIPAIVGAGVQTYTGDWAENWPKLGLPKYSDNLQYGQTEPYYDTADFWTDTSSQFAGVDPATLTAQKGYPDYIRAIVEARIINEHLRTLPTQKLIALNADPNSGETTFAQYYKMWQDRKKLVATGDEEALKAFDQDERTRNAHLGNFSQTQFALLNQYWAISDKKEQAAFLEKHKADIGVNPRQDWLRTHPNENAQLAVWGQAKILTKEAYTEFNRLIKELDIPATAIPELTLPPESSIDTHFNYEAMVDDGTHSSVEARLLLLKDHIAAEQAGVQSYVDWRNESGNPLELSDKPVEYLQLRFDNQALFDDLEEALAIPLKEERDAAVEAIRATKVGDETFLDIERRVELMGKGTREAPIPDELVNDYVAHMRIVDETSGNSAEAKLNRYDNANLNGLLMDEDVWGKQKASPLHENKFLLDNYYVPVWRYDVEYRLEDGEYNELPEADRAGREDYLNGEDLTGEALNRRLEYRADRRRREALELTNTITGDRFPLNQVEKFVEYYGLEARGKRQERFLVNNPEFAQAMHDIKGIDIPKAEDVPAVQFDDIYDLNREDFEKLEGLNDHESEYYIEDPEERAAARDAMRFTPDGKFTDFGISELTRNAYGALVPEQLVDAYVGYYKIIGEGKPKNWALNTGTDLWYEDDWYLMEHMEFYTTVYKGILGNEARDFTKIPTREVFNQYLTYISLPHLKAKDDYRWDNRELDAWLVLKFDYTPIDEKRRREDLTTYERFIEDWDARGKAIEDKLRTLRGE